MEIYLLRHGIAEDRSASGRDADRQLTDEGRQKLRKVMKRAAGAGVEASLILSSPLVRAVQTAEIAAEVLNYSGKIVKVDSLTPDSSPRDVWEEIRTRKDEPAILLAGHEPLYSATTAYLLGSTRSMVDFRKAGLVRIDVQGFGVLPGGVLQWMLTPKLA
ncbi:MAG TPA: phosphohistidine phosphatase SixA [Bryobacteraceae bacterium]|jgi:phosphohistidine phosphatase|nr:phosphohistidine phosphatase SixA [Bryobacteraceae bacterium]